MAKPETNFWNNHVKPKLQSIEGLWFEKITQVSIRGIPDVIICYKGRFIGWELKVPPNRVKLGSMQWMKLTLIDQAGGIAREVTPDNLEERIEELLCLESLSENQKLKPYQHPKSAR